LTLKGYKSHYNIKLLRGYGVSINLKENKLILKNGQHEFTGKVEKEEWFATKIPYEKF
jgi:CRISPR-associated protein Cas1